MKAKTTKQPILLLSIILLLSSCAVNKVHIKDYGEKMSIVRKHFPEIYDLHRQGTVIINELYEYEKDGESRYHISYRYR
jgi:hypothetical protein